MEALRPFLRPRARARLAVLVVAFVATLAFAPGSFASASGADPLTDPAFEQEVWDIITSESPYRDAEIQLPDNTRGDDIRAGLWRMRLAASGLPPLRALLELPVGQFPDIGWEIRRTHGFAEDRIWVALRGSTGPGVADTSSSQLRWVWDASGGVWTVRYQASIGIPTNSWRGFIDPGTCPDDPLTPEHECLTGLFGVDADNGTASMNEAWNVHNQVAAGGGPGFSESVPCSSLDIPRQPFPLAVCYRLVAPEATMEAFLNAVNPQPSVGQPFFFLTNPFPFDPNFDLVRLSLAIIALSSGDDPTTAGIDEGVQNDLARAWINHQLDPANCPDPSVPAGPPEVVVLPAIPSDLNVGETTLLSAELRNFTEEQIGDALVEFHVGGANARTISASMPTETELGSFVWETSASLVGTEGGTSFISVQVDISGQLFTSITDAEVNWVSAPELIFVPGVAGSSLVELGQPAVIWPDAFLPGLNQAPFLEVEDNGEVSVFSVGVVEVMASALGTEIYGPALDTFSQAASTGVLSLFTPFAYDWRLGVRHAAQDLATSLEVRCTQASGPVWLAAHSTGGLVVKDALQLLRDQGISPENCLNGGGVFFIATPHLGAPKAIASTINPDLFFESMFERLLFDATGFAAVSNDFLTAWELMPRANNPTNVPAEAREPWFNNPSDGEGDLNVNGDALNFALDTKAELRHAEYSTVAGTVGSLPVYNIVGYGSQTPGSYGPGFCFSNGALRVVVDEDSNVHLDGVVDGDATVPGWSGIWQGSGLPAISQYAIPDVEHGSLPNNDHVQALMFLVMAQSDGSAYPDWPATAPPGALRANAAITAALAAPDPAWVTSICSPALVVANYEGAQTGQIDASTVVEDITGSLASVGVEDDGSTHQTLVIPDRGSSPQYTLTAVATGEVTIHHTEPDGSEHDFQFDVTVGDTGELTLDGAVWEIALDRGGDGTVDETIVENSFAQADLSVAKSDSPDPVDVESSLTYTIEVSNAGPSGANGITLTDPLPDDVSLESVSASQGTCSEADETITCDLGSLGSAETATVTLVVMPSAEGTVTNTATVSAVEVDPDPSNNSATESTTVQASTFCAGLPATIVGTSADDTIVGTPGDDVIVGLDGNDTIDGLGGNDTICGGKDQDTINGNGGADHLKGGRGADTIDGGNGQDMIRGNKGADTLFGGDGADELRGRRGADTVDGEDGNDLVRGGRGSDIVKGGKGDDEVKGGDGNDTVRGGKGNDVVRGREGDDTVFGGEGDDTLHGGKGTDSCDGGDGTDAHGGGCEATTDIP